MEIRLPGEVEFIIDSLEKQGFEAYAVGGCIRDVLLGKEPKDWDITTDALPEEIKKIFPVTIDTGIAHGTVTVRHHKKSFEVTTFRTDGEYLDGRHPESVTFVRDLREDLRRRDFTVNALAYNHKSGIVDEFGGLEDLKAGIIRCVEDPERRFSEDALRMLRAARFVAQLGFELEKDTKDSASLLAPTIEKISVERICDELCKLICTERPETMKLLYELGLSRVFFPEWDLMLETEQNTKHHRASVGEHTIFVMQEVSPDKRMRLCALLHDMAKPRCKKKDEGGNDHFCGHPQVGAKMAEDFLKRMKMDNATIAFVKKMVLFHDERPQPTRRLIRRAMSRMGEDIFPWIFELRYADVLGQSEYQREEKLFLIDEFKRLYDEIIHNKECFSLKDLEVSGKDLLGLGVPGGPFVGEILKDLLSMVIDEPALNEKNLLLGEAKKIIDEKGNL